MNHDQTAPNGAVWCWSIVFAIQATKVHKQMKEQTAVIMNGGKMFYNVKYSSMHLPYLFVNIIAQLPSFVCSFCCFTSQVNGYGLGRTVSSSNHTFSWANLNKQFNNTSCTYVRL